LLADQASIYVLVGGIVIMNILFVRSPNVRAIVLHMAIGARRLHVLPQFLAEAIFFSVSGRIAGMR
jgi:macrolide transport system ATP-binding/permease protein